MLQSKQIRRVSMWGYTLILSRTEERTTIPKTSVIIAISTQISNSLSKQNLIKVLLEEVSFRKVGL